MELEFSNNKKAQDSQRRIYKGLRQILKRKDLKDVTVVDIQNECNISRTTFYRNFNNIYDVLDVIFKWYYDEYQSLKAKQADKYSFFFDYWYLHRDLLTIIVDNNLDIAKNCMKKYLPKETDPYYIECKYAIVTSIIRYWSKERKSTPEELKNKVSELLSDKTSNILIK